MSFANKIAEIQFLNANNADVACNYILDIWKKQDVCVIHFMYYASLELLRKNDAYAAALTLSNYILVDGIGMQLYFKLSMDKKMNNLNGTDLSPVLIQKLIQREIPISFYGTTQTQISACNEQLNKQYKKQILHYFQDGYSALDWEKIPNKSVLFVGLGTPMQEIWTATNYLIIQEKKLLLISVGGYFDFLSGYYARAPLLVRKIKMEWLWRTILHPARHYQKRLRDMTISFRPFLDKFSNIQKYFKILEL